MAYSEDDGNIYLLPTFHPYVWVVKKNDFSKKQYIQAASTIRMLAHELGHQTGTLDEMNNIKKWENPIIIEIEGYVRIKYKPYKLF